MAVVVAAASLAAASSWPATSSRRLGWSLLGRALAVAFSRPPAGRRTSWPPPSWPRSSRPSWRRGLAGGRALAALLGVTVSVAVRPLTVWRALVTPSWTVSSSGSTLAGVLADVLGPLLGRVGQVAGAADGVVDDLLAPPGQLGVGCRAWASSSLACFCSSASRALVASGRALNCSGRVMTRSAAPRRCASPARGPRLCSSVNRLLARSWVSVTPDVLERVGERVGQAGDGVQRGVVGLDGGLPGLVGGLVARHVRLLSPCCDVAWSGLVSGPGSADFSFSLTKEG